MAKKDRRYDALVMVLLVGGTYAGIVLTAKYLFFKG